MPAIREFIKRSPLAYHAAVRGYQLYRRVSGSNPLRFAQVAPHVFESRPRKGALFSRVLREYCKSHGEPSDPIRVVQLFLQIETANQLPPGDYIELGTHRGFTLKVIHRFMDPARTLYSFDTFEGFDARDIAVEATKYPNKWKPGNFLPTSAEAVARYVGNGSAPENLKIIKGWFPDSFRGFEGMRWRFVHIDLDLYQPIKAALETLWEPLLPGGTMLVHDYGCFGFPAARTAIDEFCAGVGILPVELGDRWGTAALRKPTADICRQFPPHVLSTFPEKQANFQNALTAYTSVSVADEPSGLHTDPIRVLNFFQLIEAANKLPSGDYIEFGSHRGYSLRVIHRFMDAAQTLYSLDTFEGFDERDIAIEQTKYSTPWTQGSFAPTSVERVAKYVGDGSWPNNLKIIEGWFPESFRGLEDKRWRFAHIDFDLYQPIKVALETIWEPLQPGGIIMVHDYGSYGFPAARKAVDEFCAAVGLLPVELPDRWSTAVLRKPLAGVKV